MSQNDPALQLQRKGQGDVEAGQIKRLEKSSLEVCTAESTLVSSRYWLNQGGMEAMVCFMVSFTLFTPLLSQLLVVSDPWIPSRSHL